MKKNIYIVEAVIFKDEKILWEQRGPTKASAYKRDVSDGKIEEREFPQEILRCKIKEEM
ncbi:hypothetical protein [Priestia megaterium]|uniref:hypothetical protein n=1 Tax=Priestia megaterium TaxID=1404 RepID=UPI00207A9712|nr:hypothetical protein [Priestia megaterium]USL27992.1 hypothetical protein LIT33_30225 [Priestia megaterium]